MERLYRGFDIIANRVHTSNQQRPEINIESHAFYLTELDRICDRYHFQGIAKNKQNGSLPLIGG